MMGFIKEKQNIYYVIITIAFFIFFFFYILLIINPVLYFEEQQPVFFFDSYFMHEYMSYPGGLTEYVSAFLSQFYYYPITGAMVITLIAFLFSLSTTAIFKSFNKDQKPMLFHLIPSAFLLSIFSYYYISLAISIGLLLSLIFFNIYTKFVIQNLVIRICFYHPAPLDRATNILQIGV